MIVRDIAEYTACIFQSCNPMLMNGMRAGFHEHMRASFIHHLFQQGIQADRIGCGMRGRNHFIADMVLHRAQQSTFISQVR